MIKKITDFNLDSTVEFSFLDTVYIGTVIGHEAKENAIKVISNKTIYFVYLSEKESKFCFLKNN